MIAFRFSLEPWTDDHGIRLEIASVGRAVDGDATVVWLHHDPESDGYLYGYWGDGIFGKILVNQITARIGDEPKWEVFGAAFWYDPPRADFPSQAKQRVCLACVIDALAQWPEGDVRLANPGQAVRRIVLRLP